jgi:hypothetical protein
MIFLEKLIIGSVILTIAFGGVVFGNVLASSNKVDINTKFCIPSKNIPSNSTILEFLGIPINSFVSCIMKQRLFLF